MNKMTPEAIRHALNEVRAGRLADATALIQSTLSRHLPGVGDPLAGCRAKPDVPSGSRRSALSDTNFGAFQGRTGARPARPARLRFTCAAGSREYVLHVPENAPTPPRGLVLMLHGCTQTPEDFAIGTGMNAQADAAGLFVVYAAQSRGDNAQSCWNWFSGADQHRDRGEPAILAGLAREVAARHGVPPGAIFVAGLSAGAAMAVILGRTYPEVFAGVGAHSGLPYGSARGVTEAFAAMAGQEGGTRAVPPEMPVPTIVFHGASDATVAPVNGMRITADALATCGQITEIVENGRTAGRAFHRTTNLGPKGKVRAEHWRIDGLGHAWSGGDAKGSYADAKGPNASAEMVRFFMSLAT